MAELPAPLSAPLGGAGASDVYGFEVCLFTGTDPELAQNRLRTIEVTPLMREAVPGADAGAVAETVRSAVRAIFLNGTRSPWRISNSDVIDANTSPVQQAKNDAANALTLAGSKTKVFYQTTAPTSGMVTGDIWYDTTEFVDSDGETKKRYTPYRWNVSLWEPHDKTLIIASEIAAGAIVADKIAANAVTAGKIAAGAITVDRLTVGSISDNLWPNGTSEIDPPSGADAAGAEFGWRLNVGGAAPSGSWVRCGVAPATTQMLSADVPCSPGASMYAEALACVLAGSTGAAGVTIQFLNSAGTDLAGGNIYNQTIATGYTKVSCSGAAPAGTVKARIGIYVSPNSQGFFDAIYARRIGAELSVAPKTTATLINGWAGPPPALQYWKDVTGVVRMTGKVLNDNAGGRITILPVGFRPAEGRTLPCFAYLGSGQVLCGVAIDPDGSVVVVSPPTPGLLMQIDLGALSFQAEQ